MHVRLNEWLDRDVPIDPMVLVQGGLVDMEALAIRFSRRFHHIRVCAETWSLPEPGDCSLCRRGRAIDANELKVFASIWLDVEMLQNEDLFHEIQRSG